MELKKVVLAPNALKGSLTSWEASEVMEQAINDTLDSVKTVKVPIADGGDDTLDVLIRHFGGHRESYKVHDPLMRVIEAPVGFIHDRQTAIIEMASASGIRLLTQSELNPLQTTTFGTGELIKEAAAQGATKIWISLGGSATVDAGIGMLQALGYQFLDQNDEPLQGGAQTMHQMKKCDATGAIDLSQVEIIALVDVENPLLGEQGAARVFGPQKGASPDMVNVLEKGLESFAALIARERTPDVGLMKHGGAAGGIAVAIHAFLGGELVGGAPFILNTLGLRDQLKDTDLVITCEGQLDHQSLKGKGPYQVAVLAKEQQVKTAALAGKVPGQSQPEMNDLFDVILPITNGACSLETAIAEARPNLYRTTRELVRALSL